MNKGKSSNGKGKEVISNVSTLCARHRHRRELESYLTHLIKLNEREMSLLVILAALARNETEKNAVGLGFAAGMSLLQPYEFVAVVPNQVRCLEGIYQNASNSPKQTFATGILPWLHTIRAVENPNLTFMVKLMWQEIAKGFERVPEMLHKCGMEQANVKGFSNIPDGFEC